MSPRAAVTLFLLAALAVPLTGGLPDRHATERPMDPLAEAMTETMEAMRLHRKFSALLAEECARFEGHRKAADTQIASLRARLRAVQQGVAKVHAERAALADKAAAVTADIEHLRKAYAALASNDARAQQTVNRLMNSLDAASKAARGVGVVRIHVERRRTAGQTSTYTHITLDGGKGSFELPVDWRGREAESVSRRAAYDAVLREVRTALAKQVKAGGRSRAKTKGEVLSTSTGISAVPLEDTLALLNVFFDLGVVNVVFGELGK